MNTVYTNFHYNRLDLKLNQQVFKWQITISMTSRMTHTSVGVDWMIIYYWKINLFYNITLWLMFGQVKGEIVVWVKITSSTFVLMVTIITSWLRLWDDCGHALKQTLTVCRTQEINSGPVLKFHVLLTSPFAIHYCRLCHSIITSPDFLICPCHNYYSDLRSL